MLSNSDVQPMLPVKDLAAAQRFYEETLGLKRLHVEPDVVVTYQSGKSTLNVYRSEFAGTNKGTAALWEVDDLEGTVEQLKAKGATFEHYDDMPGVTRGRRRSPRRPDQGCLAQGPGREHPFRTEPTRRIAEEGGRRAGLRTANHELVERPALVGRRRTEGGKRG